MFQLSQQDKIIRLFVFFGHRLLHLLDFSGLLGLVEPRLERTVEAKDRVPAFARNGLHPVDMACWRSWAGRLSAQRAFDLPFLRPA